MIPAEDELLVETMRYRDGHHAFVFSFAGRLVHEGLAPLVAHRITRRVRSTVRVTANDHGFELLSTKPLDFDEGGWRELLWTERLLEDLLECLNSTEMARRRFREIAQIAGLVHPGFPGQGRSARQLQASSELFFEVFSEFDPGHPLLAQARREVLERELEMSRLRLPLPGFRPVVDRVALD